MKVADGKAGKARARLLRDGWSYVEPSSLEQFTAEDWRTLERQRGDYQADQAASQALAMLRASEDAPTFGYRINNYQHCLQAASLCLRDGLDDESVVAALFHDIGFIVCNETHGDFAADLLAPYVGERQIWMLRHHAIFQQVHFGEYPDDSLELQEREKWRGHPHFDWTAEFVARYDQNTICPDLPIDPIECFEPIVRRVFAARNGRPDRR